MKVKQQWFRTVDIGIEGRQRKIHDVALSADGAGNLYIVGQKLTATPEVFLTKISCAGNELWRKRIDMPQGSWAFSLTADGHDNVYVTGAMIVPSGDGQQRWNAAWLSKFSFDGTELWRRALEGQHQGGGIHLAADGAGDLYLVGLSIPVQGGSSITNPEAWLAKISAAGEERWRKPLGKQQFADYALGTVAADWEGNVCFLGATEGDDTANGRPKNARAVKFSPDGTELWRKEFGTVANDVGAGLGMDGAGNIYLAGFTDGEMAVGAGSGGRDGWLMKLAPDGTERWRKRLGTDQYDTIDAVAVDGLGNIYLSGSTAGEMVVGGAQGEKDFWVAKFLADGAEQWRFQLGTEREDVSASMAVLWNEGSNRGFAVDGGGNIYLLGHVIGNRLEWFEIKQSWLAKLYNVPENFEELDELNRLRFQTLQQQISRS